jgi:glycerol kinase
MNSSSSSNPNTQQVLVLHVTSRRAKASVVDPAGDIVATVERPLTISEPSPGLAEQDPFEVIDAAKAVLREAYEAKTGIVVAVGLATERGSAIAWNPQDGQPLYPLICPQDVRTYEQCRDVAHTEAHRAIVRNHTGLSINPSFAAPKMHWLTNRTSTLGSAMGTLDSWLLYNLLEGKPHLTDRINAASTQLFNIKTLAWDEDLLKLWGLRGDLLPEPRPSFSDFGTLVADIVGEPLPVVAVTGDQQAGLYAAGTTRVGYGDQLIAMKPLGNSFQITEGVLTTLALGPDDERYYTLEDPIGPAAARVAAVHDQPDQLSAVLQQISVEVAASLQLMLTPQDKQVVMDGELSERDELLQTQQKLLPEVELSRHKYSDSVTAGVAKLTFDRMAQRLLS